jgi:zinc/manganese transport system permease protein
MLLFSSVSWLSHLPLAVAGTPTFSGDLFADLQRMFSFAFMRNAFLAGTIVALVAGLVGYFVVLRGLSFAGHALSHTGFAGAAGAVLIGFSPIAGLLIFTIGSSLLMGLLGKRLHGRDVITGIILAWMLGLGVLFLKLYTGYATEAYAVLFGQILGISQHDVWTTLAVGSVTVVLVAAMYRPLLFTSLDEELAESRGVPTHLIATAFLVVVALAVTAATQVVGVLMIFALLITPAAIAERLTTRPTFAILSAILLSLFFTWGGLTIAFFLPYPVSFFITTFAFLTYALVRGVPLALHALTHLHRKQEDEGDEQEADAPMLSASTRSL